jgi:hypothetical protein
LKGLEGQRFVYFAAEDDERAFTGMGEVIAITVGKPCPGKRPREFLGSPVLVTLFCSQEYADSTIRIICAALEALGYDAEWIRETLVPQMASHAKRRPRTARQAQPS